MRVYVDPLFDTPRTKGWRHDQASHLIADSIEGLHAFASRVGLNPCWFHKDHYDLSPEWRAKCVEEGAIEISARTAAFLTVQRRKEKRQAKNEQKTVNGVEIQIKSSRYNQTVLHEELANRALVWLSARSSFGVRGTTEFEVAKGYAADAFAFAMHQYSFWAKMRYRDGNVVGPLVPQQIASHVFEVKVSRADFLSTFKDPDGKHSNRFTPVANVHYCVTPKKLIDPSELPEFWGLLEASGVGLRVVRQPIFQVLPATVNDAFANTLLWRPLSTGRLKHIEIRQCPHCLREVGAEIDLGE